MSQNSPANAPPPVMVQCEITGQMVPEDEIINIQGHRVCADGKLELLERLRSGQGLPGQLEVPSVLRRLAGIAFDEVLLYVVYMVLWVAAVIAIVAAGNRPEQMQVVTAAVALFSAVLCFGYFLVMHGQFGRTLGKMVTGTKVTKLDGAPVTWNAAFYRTLTYEGPSVAGRALTFVFAGCAAFGLPAFMLVAAGLGTFLSGGALVYLIINGVIAASDNERQRAIHDRAAGTRVIMVT